ncbi:MAG TPA: hypothetical protein VNJ51_07265 [Candidatus Dormibacteraeota bacterium]|nr:hypothetical protein [Candidatus Dormibacteraeota bacterium]
MTPGTAAGSPFLLGVNYWPRASAMAWWSRFDRAAFDDDCARIAELGMRLVRLFPLWEEVQPERDRVDERALALVDHALDACAAHGLLAMPTLFTGHMSGVNWLPAWALDPATPGGRFRTISGGRQRACGAGDLYADERLLRAQLLLARRLAERWRGHPALFAFDLGNEFSNVREPARPGDAALWSLRLCEALAPAGVPVTGGLHGEDLERDRGIRPSTIARPWALATMHGYAIYSLWSRGRGDAAAVAFLGAAMRALQGGKPLIFSEWGGPQCPPGTRSPSEYVVLPGQGAGEALAPESRGADLAPYACYGEEELADYAMAALERLHREGALGALYWCWSDYDPALAERPPFDQAPWELRFGLCDARGGLKEIGRRLRTFARGLPVVQEPRLFDVDETAWYADPPRALREAYARYLAEE